MFAAFKEQFQDQLRQQTVQLEALTTQVAQQRSKTQQLERELASAKSQLREQRAQCIRAEQRAEEADQAAKAASNSAAAALAGQKQARQQVQKAASSSKAATYAAALSTEGTPTPQQAYAEFKVLQEEHLAVRLQVDELVAKVTAAGFGMSGGGAADGGGGSNDGGDGSGDAAGGGSADGSGSGGAAAGINSRSKRGRSSSRRGRPETAPAPAEDRQQQQLLQQLQHQQQQLLRNQRQEVARQWRVEEQLRQDLSWSAKFGRLLKAPAGRQPEPSPEQLKEAVQTFMVQELQFQPQLAQQMLQDSVVEVLPAGGAQAGHMLDVAVHFSRKGYKQELMRAVHKWRDTLTPEQRLTKPKVWHLLTNAQSGFLTRHLWPRYAKALDDYRKGGPRCFIDFIHMTLHVGGKRVSVSDHVQAMQRMLAPGYGWEEEQPPATTATAAT
jgi:hypothetical protein